MEKWFWTVGKEKSQGYFGAGRTQEAACSKLVDRRGWQKWGGRPEVEARASRRDPMITNLRNSPHLAWIWARITFPGFGLLTGWPREYFENLQMCLLNHFDELWILMDNKRTEPGNIFLFLRKGSFRIKDTVLEGLLAGCSEDWAPGAETQPECTENVRLCCESRPLSTLTRLVFRESHLADH